MTIQSRIIADIVHAMDELRNSGAWPTVILPTPELGAPSEKHFGSWSTALPMQCAHLLGKSPLQVAQDIKDALQEPYAQVQIAQPGLLNFMLSDTQWAMLLVDILSEGEAYGRQRISGRRPKIIVECFSAYPTAPLTLSQARSGYVGDVIAHVFESMGYSVTREYYLKDRGRNIELLGESVMRKYLQHTGLNVPYADELYQGDYVTALAKKIDMSAFARASMQQMNAMRETVKNDALALMIADIKRVITDKMQIECTSWISEQSLIDRGCVARVIKRVQKQDAVYEADAVQWVKTTQYGDDKDRVLTKNSGDAMTMQYDFALCYERSIDRKVDRVITMLGADHHGYEKRLKAIPQLLGVKTQYDIVFTQMLALVNTSADAYLSERAETIMTIEEWIDEVGSDAARFFFLLSPHDRHVNIDLSAVKEQSAHNPWYVVEQACARIATLLHQAGENVVSEQCDVQEGTLDATEKSLLGLLSEFPGLLTSVSRSYALHELVKYTIEIATAFHRWEEHCGVLPEGLSTPFRAKLLHATQMVLNAALKTIGIVHTEKN